MARTIDNILLISFSTYLNYSSEIINTEWMANVYIFKQGNVIKVHIFVPYKITVE